MSRLMVPRGGRRTTGRGQLKEGSGGCPITYPTDVPFGSKKTLSLVYTSSTVGPKRPGKKILVNTAMPSLSQKMARKPKIEVPELFSEILEIRLKDRQIDSSCGDTNRPNLSICQSVDS